MQPFNNFLTPAQQTSQIQALQQQIGYLQSQLQSAQSAQQMQQQVQQAMQSQIPSTVSVQPQIQPNGLTTKIVQDFDVITANDVPMDGNGALFVKSDGSEIQVRRWASDGKIMSTPYKPVIDAQSGQTQNIDNSTLSQENLKLGLSDEVTQAFMQRFDDIASRLDVIEQSWIEKKQTKSTSKAKKEAEHSE